MPHPLAAFYQLTWQELRELLPGATEDQVAHAADVIGDLLSQKFSEYADEMREQLGLAAPCAICGGAQTECACDVINDVAITRVPYANSMADTAAGPGSN